MCGQLEKQNPFDGKTFVPVNYHYVSYSGRYHMIHLYLEDPENSMCLII